jgi:hypothetical protein
MPFCTLPHHGVLDMQIKVQGTTLTVNTQSDAVVCTFTAKDATYKLMRKQTGFYWLWGRVRIFNSGFVPGYPIFNLDVKGRLTNVAWAMSCGDADAFVNNPAAAIDAMDTRSNEEELRYAERWALVAASPELV